MFLQLVLMVGVLAPRSETNLDVVEESASTVAVFYINLESSRSRRRHMELQLSQLRGQATSARYTYYRWNASAHLVADDVLQDFREPSQPTACTHTCTQIVVCRKLSLFALARLSFLTPSIQCYIFATKARDAHRSGAGPQTSTEGR